MSEQKTRWLCPKCEIQDLYTKKEIEMNEFRNGCKKCSLNGCMICSNPPMSGSKYCKEHAKTHDKNKVPKGVQK